MSAAHPAAANHANSKARTLITSKTTSDMVKCRCCGYSGHIREKCKHRDKKCKSCGKKGHLAQACEKTAKKKADKDNAAEESKEGEQHSLYLDSGDENYGIQGYGMALTVTGDVAGSFDMKQRLVLDSGTTNHTVC